MNALPSLKRRLEIHRLHTLLAVIALITVVLTNATFAFALLRGLYIEFRFHLVPASFAIVGLAWTLAGWARRSRAKYLRLSRA